MDKNINDFGQALLAALGGLIGVLMRKETGGWHWAILSAFASGFIGFLVAKACRAGGISDDMTYVIVGMSGWIGALRAGAFLERITLGKVGVSK
jgi:hypothetical protein